MYFFPSREEKSFLVVWKDHDIASFNYFSFLLKEKKILSTEDKIHNKNRETNQGKQEGPDIYWPARNSSNCILTSSCTWYQFREVKLVTTTAIYTRIPIFSIYDFLIWKSILYSQRKKKNILKK